MKNHFRWCVLSLLCLLGLPFVIRAAPEKVALAANLEVESFDNEEFAKPFKTAVYAAAFNRKPHSQAELWKLMERLGNAIEQTRDTQKQRIAAFDYKYLAAAILRQGEAADYERLIQLYQSLPRDSWGRQVMIQPLADYWIKREIEALEKSAQKIDLKIALSDVPPPPQLQAAAPELQNAWRQYQTFAVAFEEALKEKPHEGWVGVQQNWPLFYDTASDFFTGKTQNIVPRLADFRWGGWCGTGSEMLYEPRNRLLFASLLKERRYAAAIGALFPLMSQAGFLSYLESNNDWKQRFIRLCGQDWQTLFVGAALNQQATLGDLARYGSPQTARVLVQMAQVPKMTERQDYLNAIAAFIKPGDVATGYGTGSSSDIVRVATEPIPDELQKQLLKILGDQIRPDTTLYLLQTTTHILVGKARPESKDALQRLLKMPYTELREKAALALRALGDDVQIEPVKPINFRILQNGKAAPDLGIKWEIRVGDSGAMSSERTTDKNGLIQLKREALVDAPQAPRFLFAAKDMKSPNDLWFEVQRDKPGNLNNTTDVPIETGALTLQLKLPRTAAFYQGKNLLLQVSAERPLSQTSYFRPINSYEKMALPFQEQIHFSALQKRIYEIELFVPGAARWSEKITIDKDKQTTIVNLQKGADLKYQISAPGGETRDKTPQVILLHDGKPANTHLYIDYATQNYRSLPTGHYTLKVLSSAEKQKRYSSRDGQRITTPAYEGAERTFVIDENSPAVIDLGEIILRPAN